MPRCLLVGGGGREHALAKALVRSDGTKLYAALSNANPGIMACAEACLRTESDHGQIIEFCRANAIDFCVVGPEKPLAQGLTDALEQSGIPCASPSRAAARIESSKTYMRGMLSKYGTPGQIDHCVTGDAAEAIAFARARGFRVAVKPVGLTSGKGVQVWGDHLRDPDEVEAYVRQVLDSAIGGEATVVIEELLEGQEFTLHFYCDGKTAVPSPLVQDHKRAYDGDRGPNTGGMGSYSCRDGLLPFVSAAMYDEASLIGQRVVDALASDGNPFRGTLYGQFMATRSGAKVIEFNARFGDPEAINALSLLDTSFVEICQAMIEGRLESLKLKFRPVATVVLYVVPVGYPASPEVGATIVVDEAAVRAGGAEVYYAACEGMGRTGDRLTVKTTSSRTLAVYAEGENEEEARTRALGAMSHLHGSFTYRTDIGSREALLKKAEFGKTLV